ncbi:hypothetical protein HBH56_203950 [Parastagonospora nodorum]|uniref:Uncharacterized protein n=1 Tax=Phaeosphaeria nodorum (strain SN15 / ATCC MYA-4574 / FGSC 10173) TaxID=321614 RepID=A0A7U2FAH5_PHANO|nr:hypothetical protein HBH56_203950 [Parastagonospora nodorum]QRD01712.1 hypothetical protein JI435_439620 [Parastagonospora nodorum SN15]KAH3923967.1 hypothetical protein HBH54_202820 [Parastagonospora nodorum]KAH4013755.1 hypothetical protein HBI09_213510 [Parastagonospora nodorum]KAH4042782.1 hypothetical protein HBH49_242710 [Parastagonospora nodorum]
MLFPWPGMGITLYQAPVTTSDEMQQIIQLTNRERHEYPVKITIWFNLEKRRTRYGEFPTRMCATLRRLDSGLKLLQSQMMSPILTESVELLGDNQLAESE